MRNFTILLEVKSWVYGRSSIGGDHRKIFLSCSWRTESGVTLKVNGKRFTSIIQIHVRIGEPILHEEPLKENIGRVVNSTLGSVQHSSKIVSEYNSDSPLEECLIAYVIVKEEIFTELLAMRNELQYFQLDVIGKNVEMSLEADVVSWQYTNENENILYITDFNYSCFSKKKL